MRDFVSVPYYSASVRVEPAPESPSRRPGEEFFAWLDRMHELPPTVHVGEVYVHGGDAVEALRVGDDTVHWRACVPGGRVQVSYRVTFEEWAATSERRERCL